MNKYETFKIPKRHDYSIIIIRDRIASIHDSGIFPYVVMVSGEEINFLPQHIDSQKDYADAFRLFDEFMKWWEEDELTTPR